MDIGAINEKFNEELRQQITGTLPKGHTYRLGNAGSILQAASLPDLPIELQASRLSHKSMQENHPFDLSEVKGLPEAIQNPVAVFRSATRPGSHVIMTTIVHEEKNFVVAIETNRKQGDIEISSIRSVHYRSINAHIANWIGDGLLEYVDKQKMAEWFSKQRYNSADVRKLFNHAAKIVENFENPKFGDNFKAELGNQVQLNRYPVDVVNERFNEELHWQIAGTLPRVHTYRLGNAGSILQSTLIPNLPIELQASRLSHKSMQENHPFDLSEVKGLPEAIQNPVAVFRSATQAGSHVIVTAIVHEGKNFVVALQPHKRKGSIEINDIRSIHYRSSNIHIANWIGDGLLEYVDKQKMAEWFSKQRYNSAEVRKLFNHAAKIVENFENPKFGDNSIDEGLSEQADKQKMAEWFSKQRSNSAEVRNSFNRATKVVDDLENPKLNDNFLSEPGIQLQLNWGVNTDYISLSKNENYPIVRSDEPVTFSERILSNRYGITFMGDALTGAPVITSPADIAFLFKNLESAASENAFVVMIQDDDSYDVLYLSTGDATSSIINIPAIVAAADELKAHRICLVHNHPSGVLMASPQDMEVHKRLAAVFSGTDVKVLDSVIINLDSGQYVVFNNTRYSPENKGIAPKEQIIPNVYQFDRQVLYVPSNEKVQIRNSRDVAQFLSVQKRGTVNKLQAIIADSQYKISRYSFIDAHLSMRTIARQIAREVGKYGQFVFLASNNVIPEKLFVQLKNYLHDVGIMLRDVVTVKQDENILYNYRSLADEGVFEPRASYMTGAGTGDLPRQETLIHEIHKPMKVDFNILKREISLPDFLHDHYDWRMVHGSSANNPKMQSPSGDQTIVIKRNHAGAYTYWDVHNDNVKGCTIIDFMRDQLYRETGKLPSLREVGEMLQGYVNNGQTVVPTQSVYSISNELLDADAVLRIVRNLKTLEDTSFLEARGISKEVLHAPQFQNVFMQKEHVAEDGKVYNNTCVKLVNIEGVRGISQRNSHFKGCLGSRFDTIAASNIDRGRPIDMLYVGESMIDCISHFQLNYSPEKNENVLYLSSEGALTDGQVNTINKVIEANNIDKITTIFDDDRAGMLYTFKFIAKVHLPFKEEALIISMAGLKMNSVAAVNNDAEKMVYCEVEIVENQPGEPVKVLDTLFPDAVFQEFFELDRLGKVPLEKEMREGIMVAKYAVSFPFEKEILYNFAKEMSVQKQVMIDRPVENDFNDVLKQKLGIKEIATGDTPMGKRSPANNQWMDYR